MKVDEVRALLKEYPSLKQKIYDLGREHKKLQEEKDTFMAAYPQLDEKKIRTCPTNLTNDPTHSTVVKAIKKFDSHIERIANEIQTCIDKIDIVDEMLKQLSRLEREIIECSYFEKMTTKQIPIRLHISRRQMFYCKKDALEKLALFGTKLKI